MNDFRSFLLGKCRIPENKVPFYLQWISKYNTFSKNSPHGDDSLEISYLNALSRKYENWQVQQAKKAISLYFYFKTTRSPSNPNTDISIPSEIHSDWKSVKEELVRLLRLRHRSFRTEKTYIGWVRRFSCYLNHKSCSDVTQQDLINYLSYLAVEKNVSASTQRQAFNGLLFVFRNVFGKEIKGLDGTIRSGIKQRLPVVLSRKEISDIFHCLEDKYRFMAGIIYGGGLRLQECLMLRVKDIDYERNCITILSGKGNKDRQTIFPDNLKEILRKHIQAILGIFEEDRKNNIEGVSLPYALERKYPNAGKEWAWFWIFPSHKLSVDPMSNKIRRHHLYPSTLQKAFRKAVREAVITKNATIHTLRHYAERRIMPN
jgi:integron integrase